ncbi:DUF4931 domain-containing protein [Bacillus sp. Marseille-P3661]|uniref:DUF4931 domain-containing protein n=1 Tax=Bacillus sp. Marseille-P3661 TaxID=1936234 RepID=UPI000C81FCB9|nr:DUF4931 domain-containing protein [Bacillus sp. Marseille-P3661]
MKTHLVFNSSIASNKPNSILNTDINCPFCERDLLTDIMDTDYPIILLKNKYPTLENTFQTVIIETDVCHSELSEYSKEHLYQLITFGIKHWKEMISSGKYKSVLFFKNHGPYSGGSIRHPHMQIVGLEHIDYLNNVQDYHFDGTIIKKEPEVEFNISDHPRMGSFEFNVILNHSEGIKTFADYIQTATHYVLNYFNRHCNSYNLFFYELHEKIAVKIIPRFSTSPLFVGYSIPQVSNKVDKVASQIKDLYFNK